jgi:hypothetical protein
VSQNYNTFCIAYAIRMVVVFQLSSKFTVSTLMQVFVSVNLPNVSENGVHPIAFILLHTAKDRSGKETPILIRMPKSLENPTGLVRTKNSRGPTNDKNHHYVTIYSGLLQHHF